MTSPPNATNDRHAAILLKNSVGARATNKAILFELSDDLPGSRVLPDSVGVELWAMAVPKGRQAALPYVNSFLQEVRQNGELDRAMERSGLRGARLPSSKARPLAVEGTN